MIPAPCKDLIGYLLGALDDDEQSRIEHKLANNPPLRRELERLRKCLEPLDSLSDEVDPPPILVGRVMRAIDQHEKDYRPAPRSLAEQDDIRHHHSSNVVRQQRYHVSDGIVLALVGLIAVTLLLPALANSRYQARKTACQENLRELSRQLFAFTALQPDRRFPYVPASGNRSFAGIFAPILLDNQLIPRHCQLLICPGTSEQENLGSEDLGPWYVPSLAEVDAASGVRLFRLRNRAGGSYAYAVGYIENGWYRAVRNHGRFEFPILGDSPSYHLVNRQSANHGGRGQNICYEDGHIDFVTDFTALVGDDPLRNRQGYCQAGLDTRDGVLLPSALPPITLDSDADFKVILDDAPMR